VSPSAVALCKEEPALSVAGQLTANVRPTDRRNNVTLNERWTMVETAGDEKNEKHSVLRTKKKG